MNEYEENDLIPKKHFPEGMTAPTREDLLLQLAEYGRAGTEIRMIETSFSEEDIRLHYIIDKKLVLRFCSAPVMTEKRLAELNRLIGRYRAFGLLCPAFIPDPDGRFLHAWNGMSCYLAEYIDLPTAEETELRDADALFAEVRDSVAAFAEKYRDTDLSETMGMYSLFELSPYDKPDGRDEKQQNFDRLIAALRGGGHDALADRLSAKHELVRSRLKAVYRELPRCMFQGDENFSNVLIDGEQHFAGLIDFNMAGTEVIVNYFANLGGGFDEEILEPIGAAVRYEHAAESYRRYQERMFGIYRATDAEREALDLFNWIALTAGWPQVCFFLSGLKSDLLREEILDLLALLADAPLN